MNLEKKITIYKFTPQLFTLTQKDGSKYFIKTSGKITSSNLCRLRSESHWVVFFNPTALIAYFRVLT